MPIFTPEDGTGLANANSYVSVAEADDYFSTHPFYADNWADLGIPEKQNLLVTATALLDSLFRWHGCVAHNTQALGWPRLGVCDFERRVVLDTTVPQAVKIATMELAIYLSLHGDVLAPASSVGVDRLKIDVIELQFTQTQNGGSRALAPIPATALLAVRSLGEYTLGSRVRRVVVG